MEELETYEIEIVQKCINSKIEDIRTIELIDGYIDEEKKLVLSTLIKIYQKFEYERMIR